MVLVFLIITAVIATASIVSGILLCKSEGENDRLRSRNTKLGKENNRLTEQCEKLDYSAKCAKYEREQALKRVEAMEKEIKDLKNSNLAMSLELQKAMIAKEEK